MGLKTLSNLRLLNSSSGTGVSTLSVTDVFTDDFDIYKIKITCASGLEQETNLQFINSGGSVVTSDYEHAQLYMRGYSAFTEVVSSSDTDIRLVTGDEDSFGGSAIIYVFNPKNSSAYTFVAFNGSLAIDLSDDNAPDFASNRGIGVLKQTNVINGFRLANNNASATVDYTAITYGLRVD